MVKEIVTAALVLCQLSGSGFVPPGSAAPPAAEAPAAQETAVESEAPLRIALPAGQHQLGDILQQMATQENLSIQIDVISGETGYAQAVAAQYNETPPDIYWVQGEADARDLFDNGLKPTNLRTNEAGLAMYTLSRMTPAQTRVLDPRQVYGLPVGLYTEGTLVNIEQLASLLGSDDLKTLERDLTFCSYEEWAILCESITAYLGKPAKTDIRLNGHKYTMPRYRPENAMRQRGLYAIATGQPAAFLQNTLTAAFATAYTDAATLFSSSPEEMAAIMQRPLQAAFARIELDTRHMTQADGLLARGEEYPQAEKISAEAAEKLFAEGTALFIKGDTRAGIRLEEENRNLAGKLVLVPNKLPLESENVAVINEMFGISASGLLCVAEQAPHKETAFKLLAALFTTEAGKKAIEQQLHLACFSEPYPRSGLQNQLMDALSYGNVYAMPATQDALSAMALVMGEWTSGALMPLEEWGEEEQKSFISMAQGAMSSMGLYRE